MKKVLGYDLTQQLKEFAFKENRLKERIDLIRICVKTCRELTLSPPKEIDVLHTSKLVLKRDKMSRLFFFSEKKYISIVMPFEMTLKSDNTPRFHHNGKLITSEMWSKLIERVNFDDDGWMDEDWLFSYSLSTDSYFRDFENLYRFVCDTEYGYIRYDDDLTAYKTAKANNKGHHHPQHHCDIHLSNQSTFKIGLKGKLTEKQFIGILDNEQARWYMNTHNKVIK